MLTRAQAQKKAELHVRTITNIPLVLTYTHEAAYGWVFCFDSESAVATRDAGEQILGLGPVLVLARDGTVVQLGTARSLERELRAFEKTNGLRGGADG
jgi:hypothetical protein